MNNSPNDQQNSSQFDELLDHDYDGIKEYDNPLPSWWVNLFYVTVIWAFGYATYAWLGPGVAAKDAYQAEMALAQKNTKLRAELHAKNAPQKRKLNDLLEDPKLIALGAQVFAKNCAACHQGDGGGLVGPNLCDEYFLHGSSIEDTVKVISKGVISKGMLAWESTLKPKELDAVVIHVMNLRGTQPASPKAPQGDKVGIKQKGEPVQSLKPSLSPQASVDTRSQKAEAQNKTQNIKAKAEDTQGDEKDLSAQGKTLYTTCTACHGAKGEGNQALHAPSLAGQEAWYLERQLLGFRSGYRGTHPKDIFGAQMRPMAQMLADEKSVKAVVAYITSFQALEQSKTALGDSKKGQALYATCTACHGGKAEGQALLNAPRLNALPAWYIETQLMNFKVGARGTAKGDSYGAQMRPMAQMLADAQAVKDVAAYIVSLGQ